MSGGNSTRSKSSSSSSSLRGILALWSGCLGACGASFAKLAFASSSNKNNNPIGDNINSVEEYLHQTCAWLIPAAATSDWTIVMMSSTWTVCDVMAFGLVRGSFLAAMLLCNALMLGSFVQGMQESGSVAGTALATASNFTCSALLGFLLWQEHFAPIWWLGFTMVVMGTFLLSTVGILERKVVNEKTKSS